MGSKGEGGIRPRQSVEVERRKKSHDCFPPSEDDFEESWLSLCGERMFYRNSVKKSFYMRGSVK